MRWMDMRVDRGDDAVYTVHVHSSIFALVGGVYRLLYSEEGEDMYGSVE
jgi:hypothetical protein